MHYHKVALLGDHIAGRVHVHMLYDLFKPANLPFHLLEFAKEYIKKTNTCLKTLPPDSLDTLPNNCNQYFTAFINQQKALLVNSKDSSGGSDTNSKQHSVHGWKVNFLYYTESDQIVKFKDMHIRDAVIAATNITTMFIGRRLEKDWKSDPETYMKQLIPTRNVCGEGLYTLNWPASHYVRKVNASQYEMESNKKVTARIPGIDKPEPDFLPTWRSNVF